MTQSSSLLLVDADLHGLETLTYGFEREGRKVTRTSDLSRAVHLSRTSLPALAVVMLREPPHAALEVIASLRGLHGALPILVLGAPQLMGAARDAGATEFLATPTFIRDVVTVAKLVGLAAETETTPDQVDADAALSEFHGLFYLLRAMAATTRSCVLKLARGPQRAEIRFANGKVVSASVRSLQQLPALHHVLLWEEAGISIKMGAVSQPSQFPLSSQEILDESERFLRDFAHAARELGPSGTIYVPAGQPGAPVAGMQPSQAAPLLRLFDGRRGLAEVVQESPFRIFDTVRMIKRLCDDGALVEHAPVRRVSERHQTTHATGARNGARQTGPQSMLAQWAMVPDQRGVVGNRRGASRPLMPFGQHAPDQPGSGGDRRNNPSRPGAPLAARGTGAGAGARRPTGPAPRPASFDTPGPTPGPAPIPLVHKKPATGEIPEVRRAPTPASVASLELGPTVQVKLNADGTPLTLPTAPSVAAIPPAMVIDEAPPVRTLDTHLEMPSPLAVLDSAPPVAALDSVAADAAMLSTPPPARVLETPPPARVLETPPPARVQEAPRTRSGSGPRPTLSRKTPAPGGIRVTPSAAFDALEADFFAREADLYKREAIETFDDLDHGGGDGSGNSPRRRK